MTITSVGFVVQNGFIVQKRNGLVRARTVIDRKNPKEGRMAVIGKSTQVVASATGVVPTGVNHFF